MGPEKVPRTISRVEVLVHPFHDIYPGSWGGGGCVSEEQLTHTITKWKQRVKEIVADPNAALVIVKSIVEQRERPRQTTKEKERLLLMEREFYQFAKKHLERKAMGKNSPGGRLFVCSNNSTQYLIKEELVKKMEKRNMRLSKKPVFWVYGSYTTNCVKRQFVKIDHGFKISRKSKVIPSLSLPRKPLFKDLIREGYRPRCLQNTFLKRQKRRLSLITKSLGQHIKKAGRVVTPRRPR